MKIEIKNADDKWQEIDGMLLGSHKARNRWDMSLAMSSRNR